MIDTPNDERTCKYCTYLPDKLLAKAISDDDACAACEREARAIFNGLCAWPDINCAIPPEPGDHLCRTHRNMVNAMTRAPRRNFAAEGRAKKLAEVNKRNEQIRAMHGTLRCPCGALIDRRESSMGADRCPPCYRREFAQ